MWFYSITAKSKNKFPNGVKSPPIIFNKKLTAMSWVFNLFKTYLRYEEKTTNAV